MIVMVVSDQDVRELPTGALECGLDRSCLRSINGSSGHGFRIVHQDAKIIFEAEEQAGLGGHGDHSVPISVRHRLTTDFMVFWRHVKRRCRPPKLLRPAPGCGGETLHRTRYSG